MNNQNHDTTDENRLIDQGVPKALTGSTLDNWTPENAVEDDNLEMVKSYLPSGKSFLVMLGDLGRGKTHLAIGVMRQFKSALLITHDDLLYRLRQSYRNPDIPDIVDQCKRVRCLVLDDLGVCSGGSDDTPMIHHILNFRNSSFLATIITGNITVDEFKRIIGPRMTDRLRETTHRVLTFTGPSKRKRDEMSKPCHTLDEQLAADDLPSPRRPMTYSQLLSQKISLEADVAELRKRVNFLADEFANVPGYDTVDPTARAELKQKREALQKAEKELFEVRSKLV